MIEDLQAHFRYEDGVLRRRCGRHAGTSGTVTKAGYVSIVWNGKRHYAHRLVWLWFNGKWPEGVIDHIDGNPLNNCIENLREATKSQNAANSGATRAKSGAKGIRWYEPLKKWHARMVKDGREVHVGYFEDFEEAKQAHARKAKELFGDFAWAN